MHRRCLFALVAVGTVYFPCAAYGQYTDPRTYVNTPVGTEVNWTINARHSISFLFAKAVVHENAPIYTELALRYFYSRGGKASQ